MQHYLQQSGSLSQTFHVRKDSIRSLMRASHYFSSSNPCTTNQRAFSYSSVIYSNVHITRALFYVCNMYNYALFFGISFHPFITGKTLLVLNKSMSFPPTRNRHLRPPLSTPPRSGRNVVSTLKSCPGAHSRPLAMYNEHTSCAPLFPSSSRSWCLY